MYVCIYIYIYIPMYIYTHTCIMFTGVVMYTNNKQQHNNKLDSLRVSSMTIGTTQRRLAWPLHKDDTRKSRSVNT